jgi:hypothetical protein
MRTEGDTSPRSAIRTLEFWVIALAVGTGCFGGPWWVIPPVALILTLRSCISDDVWAQRFKAVGKRGLYVWLWLEQLAVNHGFALAAYAMGQATAWLWGIE